MPIVMKLKNLSSPTVVCDVCHKEIMEARHGNAQWIMGEEGQENGMMMFFTHKQCCHAFDEAARARGKSTGSQELAHFMVYLSNNIKMDWESARKNVAMIASIE